MSVTLDKVSQRTVLGNPNFSLLAKDRIVFSDSDGDRFQENKLPTLEEGHWYKVSCVKRFELNFHNEPIDKLIVGSSFIGRLDKKHEITAGGRVYLDFTDVYDPRLDSQDKKVVIDFNAQGKWGEVNFTEFCEVELNGDLVANAKDETVEITPDNYESMDIQAKVACMRGKKCALWWGERDLGDFTFNGYDADRKEFWFRFKGGTISFTAMGGIMHVVVMPSDGNGGDGDIRERPDNLYIKCLEY